MKYWNTLGVALGVFTACLPFTPLWVNVICGLSAAAHAVLLMRYRDDVLVLYATLLNTVLAVGSTLAAILYPYFLKTAFYDDPPLLHLLFFAYLGLAFASLFAGECLLAQSGEEDIEELGSTLKEGG